MPDAERVVVVTGASSGIGQAAAQQFAARGHHVAMVCRSVQRGDAALKRIRRATAQGTLGVVQGDLSTIAGVRNVAGRLLNLYPEIHVLVNNAGVWMTRRELNGDGLEMTFMVNHIAPFILSWLLAERLKASAPARIVMVNAGLYAGGEADLDQLPRGENFHRFKTYMHSKLLNVYVTLELARRLEHTGVTVNALHPGVVRTRLGNTGGPLGWMLRGVKLFWRKPAHGARPVVQLALDPALEDVTGVYFNETEPVELAANARNAQVQRAVWEQARRLVRDAVNA